MYYKQITSPQHDLQQILQGIWQQEEKINTRQRLEIKKRKKTGT